MSLQRRYGRSLDPGSVIRRPGLFEAVFGLCNGIDCVADDEDGRAVAIEAAIPTPVSVWPWLAVVIRRNTPLRERNMDIEKRPDGYWITNISDSPACGPYDCKSDAAKDRTGMARFFKHEDERAFFTVERQPGPTVAVTATDNSAANCAETVKCAG